MILVTIELDASTVWDGMLVAVPHVGDSITVPGIGRILRVVMVSWLLPHENISHRERASARVYTQ